MYLNLSYFEKTDDDKKLIFRSSVPIYQDGILAAYIAKDLPLRKWAKINGDYEFGRVSWSLFTKTLKALRPDVEFVVEQRPKFGTEDFTPFISALLFHSSVLHRYNVGPLCVKQV